MSKKNSKSKIIQAELTIQDKIKTFYSQSLKRYYLVMFAGFFIGMKLCDLVFYDPIKN
jgi:hypothetical protein